MVAGAEVLRQKLRIYQPRVVCFNGKGVYEVFAGAKVAELGAQPLQVEVSYCGSLLGPRLTKQTTRSTPLCRNASAGSLSCHQHRPGHQSGPGKQQIC